MKLLSVATLLTLSQNNPYPELIPPHTYYSKEYQIIQNYPLKGIQIGIANRNRTLEMKVRSDITDSQIKNPFLFIQTFSPEG